MFFLPWLLIVTHENHLFPRNVLTCLLVLALMGLSFEKKRPLFAFQIIFTVGLLLVGLLESPGAPNHPSGEPHIPVSIFFILILATSAFSLLVNWVRIWYQETLQAKVNHLSEVTQELQQSKARQQALLDNSLQLQLLLDTDFRILKASKVSSSIFSGITGMDLKIGSDFRDFAANEEHLQEMERDFRQTLAGNPTMGERKVEYNGQTIYLQIQYHPTKDDTGRISGVVFTAMDVTEHYKVREVLEARDRKMQALLEANPDMIFRLKDDGTCLDFKPAAGDQYHRHLERIIGSNLMDAPMESQLLKELQAAIGRATSSQHSVSWEYTMQHMGMVRHYEARIVPAADGEVVALVRDVTQEREAQKKIRESQQLLSSILQAIPSPVFFKDSVGRYLGCNHAFENFIGIKQKDLVGKTPFDIAPTELSKIYHENDLDLMANPRFIQYESHVRNAKGEVRDVIFFKAPIYGEGDDLQGLVGVIIDITEQKQNTIELIKAKKNAEAATRAKAEFLSIMSHEIRTPMNAVIGAANLLIEENPREDQQDYLDTLKFSAENLLALINDILDFNKIEAGRVVLKNQPTNLHDACEQVVHSLEDEAKTRNLELKLNFEGDRKQMVVMDRIRFNQILLNLLNNALKFTHEGGVSLNVKQLDTSTGISKYLFEIIDTGIGISADDLEKIFGFFTQASSTHSREFGGTGLGLTIAQRLVALFEGTLKVESEPGKGSRFFFELLFKNSEEKPEARTPKQKTSNAPATFNREHILVVEDSRVNQKIIGRYLRKWNLEVTYAQNGLEGVNACEEALDEGFDLILMDLQMPIMDGYEATRLIRKLDAPKSLVPIVAVTASAEAEAEVAGKGLDDYISKPFSAEFLHAKVASNLRLGQERKEKLLK